MIVTTTEAAWQFNSINPSIIKSLSCTADCSGVIHHLRA